MQTCSDGYIYTFKFKYSESLFLLLNFKIHFCWILKYKIDSATRCSWAGAYTATTFVSEEAFIMMVKYDREGSPLVKYATRELQLRACTCVCQGGRVFPPPVNVLQAGLIIKLTENR